MPRAFTSRRFIVAVDRWRKHRGPRPLDCGSRCQRAASALHHRRRQPGGHGASPGGPRHARASGRGNLKRWPSDRRRYFMHPTKPTESIYNKPEHTAGFSKARDEITALFTGAAFNLRSSRRLSLLWFNRCPDLFSSRAGRSPWNAPVVGLCRRGSPARPASKDDAGIPLSCFQLQLSVL